MKKYEIKIKGAAPMLQDKLDRELIKELSTIESAKKDKWEDENWERKLYKNDEGQIIIPNLMLQSFLIEACKKYKVPPPKNIGRTWTTYVKSSVMVQEAAIMNCTDPVPYGCMVNGNPSSGKSSSKVWKVRPRINEWKATVKIIDISDELDTKKVDDIFSAGGLFVGIGNWRPLHGRFTVEKVTEVAA